MCILVNVQFIPLIVFQDLSNAESIELQVDTREASIAHYGQVKKELILSQRKQLSPCSCVERWRASSAM